MTKIIHNAKIYTQDAAYPVVSAVAIAGGRIRMAGSDQEVLAEFSSRAAAREIHNAQGRTIIPGLIDAHIHLEHYAFSLQKVDCETSTREGCLRRVAQRSSQLPAGEWVLGHGWNQNSWQEGFGSASDLDTAAPHHKVYLTAKSLHAGWANSAALQAAGVTTNTPDPPGGQIVRDLHGNPTGILLEGAMELVQTVIEEPTDEQVSRAIQQALGRLAEMGITGAHDFDRKRCFAALQMLHREGALTLRVLKSIPLDDLNHAVALGLRTGFGDDTLRVGGVKAFADGALGPKTAAMLQPYEGDPENRGMLLLDAEELSERGCMAAENGLAMAVHAIGDRANHAVLDAFSQIRLFERRLAQSQARPFTPLRHRIEHVQIIHPDDAGRLAEMGVIASMQPIHAPSDMLMADRYWGQRSANAYAWRSQLNHGAVLAFGSDAPVESPNPFWGLHAAVTRRRHDGTPGAAGWYAEQRLTIAEALRGFTLGPAYTAYQEHQLGKLAPGYLADLLVLDEDLFQCEPDEVKNIHPLATMLGGIWVFGEL